MADAEAGDGLDGVTDGVAEVEDVAQPQVGLVLRHHLRLDAGRTGNSMSVGGLDSEIELRKFLTQIPEYSNVVCENLELQGVIIDIDESGAATAIQTIKLPCEEEYRERARNNH